MSAADGPEIIDVDRSSAASRRWLSEAVRRVQADANRSADTHLIPLPLTELDGVDVYLKDESTHPTGSLKHRLARSLFLYGLCSGWLDEGTTVIEASSGSTAVSEAYFARMLGLPFVAVVPRATSPRKLALIEREGGRCHYVDNPTEVYEVATRLAAETGGCYLDQFTHAERATDWRGNNNIAESIFAQMQRELHPVPTWIVVGAGTGGTSATIGRFIRFQQVSTRLAVVDPEGSVFFRAWCEEDPSCTGEAGSRIEGIGRPRVEPSFVPSVIDRMLKVPDSESIAAMQRAEATLGRKVGPSTGTNLAGVLAIGRAMVAAGETGSIVSLLCDDGDRYSDTFHDQDWLDAHHLAPPTIGAAVVR